MRHLETTAAVFAGRGVPDGRGAVQHFGKVREWHHCAQRHVVENTQFHELEPGVSGTIKVRRLLFLHAGIPYVISWGALADEYEGIAELVEHCASSLRHTD